MSGRWFFFGAVLTALLAAGCGSRRAVSPTTEPVDGGGQIAGDGYTVSRDGHAAHPRDAFFREGIVFDSCAFTTCGGACVDTSSDPSHCGACYTPCPPGFVCQGGGCACPGSLTECYGACVDLSSDPANCGTCGAMCSTACQNGQCALAPGCSYLVWNGHTYAKCTTAMSWQDAKLFCLAKGAHLVTLNSAAEDAFIFSISSKPDGVDYWTGFNDINLEGQWEWESGEPVTYVGFAPGEPNNAPVAPGGEDCASWYYFGAGWNDNRCDLLFPFVCEWSSPSVTKTFINPTVDGKNLEWGAGGGYDPGMPHAFCKLVGFDHAVSWECCGGSCGSDQECQFTQCEIWYFNGAWSDGNCDGVSFDVLTKIVCVL